MYIPSEVIRDDYNVSYPTLDQSIYLLGKIAAHSAYDMFSLNKYLILFLIAPFPDRCLLVPFFKKI